MAENDVTRMCIWWQPLSLSFRNDLESHGIKITSRDCTQRISRLLLIKPQRILTAFSHFVYFHDQVAEMKAEIPAGVAQLCQ